MKHRNRDKVVTYLDNSSNISHGVKEVTHFDKSLRISDAVKVVTYFDKLSTLVMEIK